MLRGMSQSWEGGREGGRRYSKSVDLPLAAWGKPTEAILVRAGYLPVGGGGVVLPSKTCCESVLVSCGSVYSSRELKKVDAFLAAGDHSQLDDGSKQQCANG